MSPSNKNPKNSTSAKTSSKSCYDPHRKLYTR